MISVHPQRSVLNRSDSRKRIAVCVWVICCCLVVSRCSPVNAQTNPVAIESAEIQPSLVIGRPMLTWWKVMVQGPGLAVGKFKFIVKHDNDYLCSAETEELTIGGPEQRIRVMLPSVDSLNTIDQLHVEVSYEGKTFTGPLGRHILRVPFATKKVFNCMLVELPGTRKNSVTRDRTMELLRFENLVLELGNRRQVDEDREQAKTIFPSLDPADLPPEAMAYCSYDVVAITSEAFRSLRKPQLEALLAWTRAGGSVYVEPGGVLEPYHLDFLRSLIATDDSATPFVVDTTGKLMVEDQERDAISSGCGLGFAVVRLSEPGKVIDNQSEAWHKTARPLWRARYAVLQDRVLNDDWIYRGTAGNPYAGLEKAKDELIKSKLSLQGNYRHGATSLLLRLLPDGVRMVPVWVLTLILMTYVALIGPGDYFVLGWLKARKFTWLTFPVSTLAIALVTIWLSNSYMSTSEVRRAVVLKDLDNKGEVVRTNRMELLYIASSRWVPTLVEKGYFSPLKTSNYKQNPRPGVYNENSPDISMRTEGRIPTEYVVTQSVAKWSPQINRVFSIPGDITVPEIDWSEFNLDYSSAPQILKHELPAKLGEVTHRLFGQKAMVACFAGINGWAYDRSPGWTSSHSMAQQAQPGYPPNWMNQEAEMMVPEIHNCRSAGASEFFAWIYTSAVGFSGHSISRYIPASNIFSVIKQTAPKGGANCDDLPILDATDPDSWLLVVIVPDKEDLIVYRKLMRFQKTND